MNPSRSYSRGDQSWAASEGSTSWVSISSSASTQPVTRQLWLEFDGAPMFGMVALDVATEVAAGWSYNILGDWKGEFRYEPR